MLNCILVKRNRQDVQYTDHQLLAADEVQDHNPEAQVNQQVAKDKKVLQVFDILSGVICFMNIIDDEAEHEFYQSET